MSLPYVDTTKPNSTTTTVVLGSNANTGDNYYNNYSISIDGQTVVIASYNGSTSTATLMSALTAAPKSGDPFIICNSSITVISIGLVSGASTVSSVVIGSGKEVTDIYSTNYLTLGTDTVKISGYSGATLTATLATNLSGAPTTGEAYAICKDDPSAFLFGLNTSFIGGNRYFEIAVVVCIIVLSISCVVSLLFMMSASKNGNSGNDGVPQQAPMQMSFSLQPTYYPPTYNR